MYISKEALRSFSLSPLDIFLTFTGSIPADTVLDDVQKEREEL